MKLPNTPLFFAGLLLSSLPGFGQSAPAGETRPSNPAPSQPATPAKTREEAPVELSKFTVSTAALNGYATSSSMTVSRVATKITEIPVSALVINEKLIDDTMAVGVEDTFNLISGLHHGNAGTGNQENNDFSLRGYAGNTAQRDGVDDSLFTSAGGFDYTFVERIEVVKGPNGILYGTHSPGGVVNIISKRPRAQPFTKISAMGGSWGFRRGEIDTSQFLDEAKHFSYRVAAAITHTDGPVNWPGDPKKGFRGINPSVLYRSNNGLEIWAWTAFIRDSSSRAKHVTPGFATSAPINASTPGPTGVPLIDDNLMSDGAGQNLITAYSAVNTDSYEIGTSKSFQFGPVSLDARFIGRYRNQLSDASRVRATADNKYLDANGNLLNTGLDNRTTPLSSVVGKIVQIYRERFQYDSRPDWGKGQNYNVDLNFNYATSWANHQTLIAASYGKGDRDTDNSNYLVTDPTMLAKYGYGLLNGKGLVYTYPKRLVHTDISRDTVLVDANVRQLQRTLSNNEIYGVGFMQRMALLGDRLIFVGGGRLQHVMSSTGQWNFTTNNVPAFAAQSKSGSAPSIAGLWKFHKTDESEAVVFVNLNRTFTPVFDVDQRLATLGKKFDDRSAKAKEVGIKTDLFHGRVVATASVFDNEETNYLGSFLDDNAGTVTGRANQGYQAPVGTRTSKGVELDVNVKVTKQVETIFSFGTIKSQLANGLRAEAMPYDTAAALVNYRFDRGWLKGFTVTYNYTHWGKSRLGSRTYWEIPGGNRHNVILGYHWKRSDIRLRIENIFDVRDPEPSTFDQSIGITNPINCRLGYTLTL